ncbi:glycoside hydrolase family 130 protein [Clostridium sp. Mt-5]|uniref:Glycoside hydrolase family 130 protein n=1 Tax=Clostridium moutaii TaxID=3240932 RepID=A0ABV4BRT5_9CLOT
MGIKRHESNPIITCEDVNPSNEDFEIIGVFNPGAARYKGEIILAMRIAERFMDSGNDYIKVPVIDRQSGLLKILNVDKGDSRYDFSDSRVIKEKGSPYDFACLTSMSHIRLARSADGVNFKIDSRPFIYPGNEYESFGIEDPRITEIDGSYYITYSAVSPYGIVTGLAVTSDFKNCKKLGNIFGTENKDVVIFPEKINGRYFALNRPVSKSTGDPVIWISESDNLLYWGNHKVLACNRKGFWDSKKIGAGIPPVKTDEGWLELYHGVDEREHYSMGALLLDMNCPSKIIARSEKPLLKPQEDYETGGFFSNVIFPCGAVKRQKKLYIYYGISDNSIGLAVTSVEDILNTLV